MNRVQKRAISPLPSPDIIVEVSPHDATVLVGPCHQRAAEWLRAATATGDAWVGEAVVVEHRYLEAVVARAIDAGFTVALRFDAQTRIVDQAAGLIPTVERRDSERGSRLAVAKKLTAAGVPAAAR